jgi:hypothetical protein
LPRVAQARDDLRAHFERFVPKPAHDPYSLDFLNKKRGAAAAAAIGEKDLRAAVAALGWHTLTDAEVLTQSFSAAVPPTFAALRSQGHACVHVHLGYGLLVLHVFF